MRGILTFLCVIIAAFSWCQSTPKRGSAERTAILNALRTPVQKELGLKVQFKVDWLKLQGSWAFLRGVPQRADGGKIDYRKTKYKEQIEAGVFDNWICALLRKRNGKWAVVTYVIGATDVAYEPWPQQYGAPKAIFDLP